MNILPVLKTGKLIVLYTPEGAGEESMALIAELSLRGPVTVLDGGNRYKPYRIATLLRRKTVDIAICANRVLNQRAFTCYEMHTLLSSPSPQAQPYILLDLLNTFYDDHVPSYEAQRLLGSCLSHIQRLLISGPVVVTLSPPLVTERAELLERVCRQADQVFIPEIQEPLPTQLALF